MDRKIFYKRLGELIDTPTDRNDILTKRFGAPMKKMTYRDTCIDYVKKTVRCVGYRDYIVSELDKLEKIEQIVKQELSPLSPEEMSNAEIQIREILEQE